MVALFLRARRRRRRQRRACLADSSGGGGGPYSFVVPRPVAAIRAWLFPDYCQRAGAAARSQCRVPRCWTLMPAPGLIFSEWDKPRPPARELGAPGPISRPSAKAAFCRGRSRKRISRIVGAEDRSAPARSRRPLHQGQSRPLSSSAIARDPATRRDSANVRILHEQGPPVPCLRGDRSPRLPAAREQVTIAADKGADETHKGSPRRPSLRGAQSDEAIHVSACFCVGPWDCFRSARTMTW